MSYYEDVYLQRINQHGNTRQERILNSKAHNFENFLMKSIYKVDFSCEHKNYIGSLQPGSGDEKNIVSYMLTSKDIELKTGSLLDVTSVTGAQQKWLITFKDNNDTMGYNKYKVYLLDRVLTWYDKNKREYQAYVNVASIKDNLVKDIFRNIGGSTYRESQNYLNLIMKYNENIQREYYCLLDGSPRAFVVSGFDCETVPGVQYVTADITLVRNKEDQIDSPGGFWGSK